MDLFDIYPAASSAVLSNGKIIVDEGNPITQVLFFFAPRRLYRCFDFVNVLRSIVRPHAADVDIEGTENNCVSFHSSTPVGVGGGVGTTIYLWPTGRESNPPTEFWRLC